MCHTFFKAEEKGVISTCFTFGNRRAATLTGIMTAVHCGLEGGTEDSKQWYGGLLGDGSCGFNN